MSDQAFSTSDLVVRLASVSFRVICEFACTGWRLKFGLKALRLLTNRPWVGMASTKQSTSWIASARSLQMFDVMHAVKFCFNVLRWSVDLRRNHIFHTQFQTSQVDLWSARAPSTEKATRKHDGELGIRCVLNVEHKSETVIFSGFSAHCELTRAWQSGSF